jgi:hypothetical protein
VYNNKNTKKIYKTISGLLTASEQVLDEKGMQNLQYFSKIKKFG